MLFSISLRFSYTESDKHPSTPTKLYAIMEKLTVECVADASRAWHIEKVNSEQKNNNSERFERCVISHRIIHGKWL